MPGKRLVIKIGGSTLGGHDTTLEDLVWLQAQGHQAVVIHGGGKVITEWLERQGVPSRFVRGLRVTDEAVIGVVVAVLAGLVNKQLVAGINSLGGKALGLSGTDGSVLRARIKDPELGLVGEPSRVDSAVLDGMLGLGLMPVLSPIGVLETKGMPTETLLNINADTAAGAIGGAVRAEQALFLTDVPGVKGPDDSVLRKLGGAEARALIASGIISGGMVPKVEACLAALERVSVAVILDGRQPHALKDFLSGKESGTRIGDSR